MAGHVISGPTDHVIISTGGRAVAQVKSFSQPVSAFEFARTCVPILSESSCSPKIFLVPVMPTSPLRPSYDWNVLMHPYEEFNYRWLCDVPVLTPPEISVFQYLEQYPACLGIGRF